MVNKILSIELKKAWPTLFLLLSVWFVVSSCKGRKSGEQPLLDSTYITKYMTSKAAFKDQIYWAMQFYNARAFRLGWFKDHEIVPQADTMLQVIGRASEEGLDPKDYQVVDFNKLFDELKGNKRNLDKRDSLEKEIDVALSATYFNWASDYYRGLLKPRETKKTDWDVKRNRLKLDQALMAVLGEKESTLPYASFHPLHPEYAHLKKALANLRRVQAEGGWAKIPTPVSLAVGQHSSVVPLLRKRLAAFMSDSTLKSEDDVFDQNLADALKSFQEFNELKVTGSLSPETVNYMNVPVADRIRQVIINMERWRWIPQSFEPNYIFVNIPEYKLHVFEKGKEVMNMKVIVGKDLHSTPVFNDKMESVVLAPYWNIPPGILKNEIAPKAASNPNFLSAMDMEVVSKDGTVVDPSSVDWSTAGTPDFHYTVRRKPGPKNDLGRVKFIFPNSMNIYLHDTPASELFNQSKRQFSHGCVRVEKPIDLAVYLLRDVPGWNRQKILDQIGSNQQRYVGLKQKVPVYLLYFTASADSRGRVRFYEDIYGHDQQLKTMYFNKL